MTLKPTQYTEISETVEDEVSSLLNQITDSLEKYHFNSGINKSSLEQAIKHSFLSPDGQRQRVLLMQAIESIRASEANPPKEYPGAYHKSITEMYAKFSSELRQKRDYLAKETLEFQERHALVPGLKQSLDEFVVAAEVSLASPGISEDAKTYQSERLAAAEFRLHQNILSLMKINLPTQMPKDITSLYSKGDSPEGNIKNYLVATELALHILPGASGEAHKAIQGARTGAFIALKDSLNQAIYKELVSLGIPKALPLPSDYRARKQV